MIFSFYKYEITLPFTTQKINALKVINNIVAEGKIFFSIREELFWPLPEIKPDPSECKECALDH